MKAIVIEDDFCKVCNEGEGGCGDPICVNGREVSYFSLIRDISLGGMGTSELEATMNFATYIDLDTLTTPIYQIDLDDGVGYHVITVGNTVTLDVSGFADGLYVGNFREVHSNAICYFWYVVAGGLIVAMVQQRSTELTYELGCELYPNYKLTMSDVSRIHSDSLVPYRFTASEIKILNTIVNNENYIGELDYTEEAFLTTNLNTAHQTIVATNKVNLVGSVQNLGIFKTRCVIS